MLLELSIENFILIENITIPFSKGLNIISGETGAGKSIVIGAINLVLGGKSSKEYIRRGKEKAVIQAVFHVPQVNVGKILEENGIDIEDDILIFTREIYESGRSIARINGRIISLSTVKEISQLLLDIHGQHEHQSLLYSENHMNMLDLYGSESITDLKLKVNTLYKQIKDIELKLSSLNDDDKERERKIDLLRFQIEDIDSCQLQIGEDEELSKQYNLLKNSKQIFSTVSNVHDMISSNLDEDVSISYMFSRLLGDFEQISKLDENLNEFNSELQDIHYRLQDIATDLRHYKENITFDPDLLFEIEKRLDNINNLKRKYGNSIEEILNYRDQLNKELFDMENSTERINQLKKEIEVLKEQYLTIAIQLSEQRKGIGKDFEKKMIQELKYLNLDKSKFVVSIEKNIDKDNNVHLSSNGIDKIEFLISTNPGEPIKPLAKIASGGEMSRIMLAMKVILAKIDNIPTLIFDEIDTGISGKTANIVGEKLAIVSNTRQIICITHLPQIAVMGDNHLFINKELYDEQTITNIKTLASDERVKEISRLIGGNIITELTIENAKELLEMAKRIKEKNL